MILYAKLDDNDFINGFSDIQSSDYNTEFEIDDSQVDELSACSGHCFKVENGVAVKKKDIGEYLAEHSQRAVKIKEIVELKAQLLESDYKAIKYSEGFFTEEEYQPIRDERAGIRLRINQLEEELQ